MSTFCNTFLHRRTIEYLHTFLQICTEYYPKTSMQCKV